MAEQTEFDLAVVTVGELSPHPNADRLEITHVSGRPVVVRKGEYAPGDSALYVPVDALVPTSRPEFAFLAKPGRERHRVQAARLRGVFSMGLLVKVPAGSDANSFGIEKYVSPQERALEGQAARTEAQRAAKKAGGLQLPVYGLDSARKYADTLRPGEEIVVTEKIHGCNARYCYTGGRLWVGSHKMMRGCSPSWWRTKVQQLRARVREFLGLKHRSHLVATVGDVWWEIAQKYDLENKLRAFPDMIVYGEVFGDKVQDMTYGCAPRERRFLVFDIQNRKTNEFLSYAEFDDMAEAMGLETVPVLAAGELGLHVSNVDELWALAEGESKIPGAKHIREGVVVKPVTERVDPLVGRVALKFVGQGYLLRGEK